MSRELVAHLLGMPFNLIGAHALADFPLQGDFLAKFKNPCIDTTDRPKEIPWWIPMSAHCMIHSVFVYFLTGSLILGCLEFMAHFQIDYAKCCGWITFTEDQAAHIVCKLLWCALLLTWKGLV